MAIKELSLNATVVQDLATEFGDEGIVSCPEDRIMVMIAGSGCQRNFGNILQRVHRVVEAGYPERAENLFILVRDEGGLFQNWIKIWKSA